MTFLLVSVSYVSAQAIATTEIKENNENICKPEKVYTVIPTLADEYAPGQPLKRKKMEAQMNKEMESLQSMPDTAVKGMLTLVINCRGEVAQAYTDLKDEFPELDKEITAQIMSMGNWKPGVFKKKKVDTMLLVSFTVKDGKIELSSFSLK